MIIRYYTFKKSLLMESENNQNTNRVEKYGDKLLEYPNFWHTTRSISKIINDFKDIESGTRLYDNVESIIGRILQSRASGKNLYFYTLVVDGHSFQIMSDVKSYQSEQEFYEIHDKILLKLKHRFYQKWQEVQQLNHLLHFTMQ